DLSHSLHKPTSWYPQHKKGLCLLGLHIYRAYGFSCNQQVHKRHYMVCLKFASVMIQLVVDDSQKTAETESKEQTVFPESTNITSDLNATENEST
nr:dentin sialophosphoprotein-like isoform X1 [Tanacetum cinerariifolium]